MNYISKLVRETIKKYGTNNPFALCDMLNIYVEVTEMPHDINGFFTRYRDLQFIFLSRSLNEIHKRAVCAHELAHAMLHPSVNAIYLQRSTLFAESKFEHEADIFAANLLLPTLPDFQFFEGSSFDALASELSVPTKYLRIKISCTEH